MKLAGTLLVTILAALANRQIPKTTVVVIVGQGLDLHCDKHGCTGPDAYWTGKNKSFVSGWPNGWSNKFGDAKQYGQNEPDPYFDIPNGMHCCYAEYPTLFNIKTGKAVDWK